ncbi:MAG: hypothetical protein AAB656_03575 [Patescibacteria group bacterium]
MAKDNELFIGKGASEPKKDQGLARLPKNTFFQLDNGDSALTPFNSLGILPRLQKEAPGAFVRLDATSDDLSLTVNGIHIIRIHNNQISDLTQELARPEMAERLVNARNEYSDAKVAGLLKYSPGVDYRLPDIVAVQRPTPSFNPYYVYYRIMGMPLGEFRLQAGDLPEATPETVFARKREAISQIYKENGMPDVEFSKGYGFKRLKKEIEAVSAPLVQVFKEKVSNATLETIIGNIAQRYTPGSVELIQEQVQRITSVFSEMYSRAKNYGVLMPKEQQFLRFFTQVAERVFEENTNPLNIFVVTCPRYGEQDELSETANAYLYALPHITQALTRGNIPYRGYVLIDDAEEHVADGLYLSRLGLTPETYQAQCTRNVDLVKRAITEDERINGVSVHPFGTIFPDFVDITADLERQLYKLAQDDADLRLSMAKVADTRKARHTKILGGECDFSDSLYLAIHYSAEYMALGYLCRSYPELSEDSFIVNYNSPNVEQFNSTNLLAKCIKRDVLKGNLATVPIFQVKLY